MTQIREAFERAAKDAALKKFSTIFTKAFKETVEENITKALAGLIIPQLSSSNIASLQPDKLLNTFATGVEQAIEDMFQNACRAAKFQAMNVTLGRAYARGLENMKNEEFRQAQHEVITEYLAIYGSPAVVIAKMTGIIECFFAQNLLNRLIATHEEHANDEFIAWMDKLIRDAATSAFLAIIDDAVNRPAGQYKVNILPCVIKELTAARSQYGDNTIFNNVAKHVYGAFIIHQD